MNRDFDAYGNMVDFDILDDKDFGYFDSRGMASFAEEKIWVHPDSKNVDLPTDEDLLQTGDQMDFLHPYCDNFIFVNLTCDTQKRYWLVTSLFF